MAHFFNVMEDKLHQKGGNNMAISNVGTLKAQNTDVSACEVSVKCHFLAFGRSIWAEPADD